MKQKIKNIISVVLVGCLLSNQVLACAHSAFSKYYSKNIEIPSITNIALSDVPIHTKPYYEWVIKEKTEKQINHQNTLDDLDDLAVAYNKTGQKDKAIEVLNEVLKNNPNRYSSLSNIASSYINLNDYDKGLEYLHRANKLNSDDNYDREYAQEKVYSYLKSLNKKAPYSFPVNDSLNNNFANYIVKNLKDKNEESEERELLRVFYGIFNMVRFGNTDNPFFSEAMGDILDYINNKYLNNSNLMAQYVEFLYISSYIKGENKNDINSINKFTKLSINEREITNINDLYKEVKNKREKVKLEEIELINNSNNLDEKSLDKKINEKLVESIKNNSNQLDTKDQLNNFITDVKKEQQLRNVESILNQSLDITKTIFYLMSVILFFTSFFLSSRKNEENNDDLEKIKSVNKHFIYLSGIMVFMMLSFIVFNGESNIKTMNIIFALFFVGLSVKSIKINYLTLKNDQVKYKKILRLSLYSSIIFILSIILIYATPLIIETMFSLNGYQLQGYNMDSNLIALRVIY